MDLGIGPAHLKLEAEVKAFLAEAWRPEKGWDRATRKAYEANFRRAATERGYLYRGIPRRFGGGEQAPDVLAAEVIRAAFAKARAPMEISGNGITMVTPTLLECGSEAQQQAFIPPTIAGEYRWAQGYSEPGAGSDLASLRTRAELVGDEWVINGHKIWTSFAYDCTHMFALVRTEPDASKHDGISYLLVPLDQPGVTIRRIRQISGQSEFCEVFLENVRTPADWLVGERGKGWQVSKSTLKHERNSVGGGARTQALFDSLIRFAKSAQIDGRPALEHPLIADRIVRVEARLAGHIYSGYYQLTRTAAGEPPGLYGLMNKLSATEIGKEIALIAQDILDVGALIMPAEGGPASRNPEQWLNQIFGSLGLSIAGGASNIQRNIIAERGLGLPKEPEAG